MDQLNILYIAGYPRSGTTLLARIAAQMKDAVSAGELYFLFAEGWSENRLCECKKPFHTCEYWQKVIDLAYGKEASTVIPRILQLQQQVDRHPNLPQLYFPFLRTPRFSAALKEYQELLGKLYRALMEVNNVRLVVDPSKHIAHALILSEMANVKVIHMLRDIRAVAFSVQKQKRDPSSGEFMPVVPDYRNALIWDYLNIWSELLANRASSYMRLRYEDLVTNPAESLKTVVEFAGVSLPEGILDGKYVDLQPTHSIGGNPDRFVSGKTEIKPDLAWQDKLPASSKFITDALTWPLLLRYNYTNSKK